MKRLPRTSEDRSCGAKQSHGSLKAALDVLANMVRRKEIVRGEMQAYLCRFCHGWHLGHPSAQQKKEQKKVRKPRRAA